MDQEEKGMMTEGVIWKQLVKFSLPLVAANLFQQLYNTFDSIVVGRYIGQAALAAVGASTPITMLVIGFFMGMGTGASILISNYYGAGKKKDLEETVQSSAGVSLIGGAVLTLLGCLLAPFILKLMGTPQDVFAAADDYLRIYFEGVLFLVIYNIAASILRAVGNSRVPLLALMMSCIVNIVLNLVFVVQLHMGVKGVGYATVIAEFVSAVIVVAALVRTDKIYRLDLKRIRLVKDKVIKIISLGVPSGAMQSVIGLSNTIVQSKINLFGSVAMAGSNVCSKIDGFLMMPIAALSMAATTFAGQNLGAGKLERVKKGLKVLNVMGCGYVIIGIVLVLVFRDILIQTFSDDAEVWHYAALHMNYMLAGYLFLSVSQQIAGILRGAGRTMITMIISTGCWCGLRILWIQIALEFVEKVDIVYMGYPISWIASAIIFVVYYYKVKWYENKI